MFIKDMKIESFPVGSGRVTMDLAETEAYHGLLVDIGSASPLHLSAEEREIFNDSHAPSHAEMVERLAPAGEPDLIILCYWMPDIDMLAGDSPVSSIRAKYQVDAKQTMVLSEDGPGVLCDALEFSQRALASQKYKEVWIFYLNQFQGGSQDDGPLFWHEPGRAVWLRLVEQSQEERLPKLSIERITSSQTGPQGRTAAEVWETQFAALRELSCLSIGESWRYNYSSDYNQIGFEVSAMHQHHQPL